MDSQYFCALPSQELRFLRRARRESCTCGWTECRRIRHHYDNRILAVTAVIEKEKK